MFVVDPAVADAIRQAFQEHSELAACPSYAGYRFLPEFISHAVWLYFRFPLSLRMVDELLAARDVIVSHETVRQWR